VAAEDVRRERHHLHRVLDVVDGDTVTVDYRGSEVSVRVIGIDTPETVHPSEPVECGGPQASAAATRLLSGKKVRLVFDPSQGRTDSYGRTLAYLEAPGVGDFGLAMVRQGRAAEYTYDSAYARQARYLNAQDNAQTRDRGIWNRCGGVDTPLRQAKPAPAHQPRPRSRSPRGGSCDPGYDPCIPAYPPDLDCGDVDGPIRVTGDDPHGFDADGDGIGCDS
jgi:micrococcal nuclease